MCIKTVFKEDFKPCELLVLMPVFEVTHVQTKHESQSEASNNWFLFGVTFNSGSWFRPSITTKLLVMITPLKGKDGKTSIFSTTAKFYSIILLNAQTSIQSWRDVWAQHHPEIFLSFLYYLISLLMLKHNGYQKTCKVCYYICFKICFNMPSVIGAVWDHRTYEDYLVIYELRLFTGFSFLFVWKIIFSSYAEYLCFYHGVLLTTLWSCVY